MCKIFTAEAVGTHAFNLIGDHKIFTAVAPHVKE